MSVKRIHRGLRIVKSPIIGKDNENFCDKWCAILNKFAFDLMALTVQELSTQLSQIKEEIVEVKTCMCSEFPREAELNHLFQECDQHNNDLKQEIIVSIKIKF